MRFDIVTIFPGLFAPFRDTGVLGKAVARGLVELEAHDLRDWSDNRWRQVDDEPYGGGAGMVLQAPPVLRAARDLLGRQPEARLVLTSPRGRLLDHDLVRKLCEDDRLVILCGRYEGFDERIADLLQPDEISIGDFVLGGGEVAAMAIVEAVSRLVPGVVGDPGSVAEDSFSTGLLDYPCYTRPAEVEGCGVPAVLTSGDHEAVRRWRLERAVAATVTRRPDLINRSWERLSDEARELVRSARETDDSSGD